MALRKSSEAHNLPNTVDLTELNQGEINEYDYAANYYTNYNMPEYEVFKELEGLESNTGETEEGCAYDNAVTVLFTENRYKKAIYFINDTI